MQGLEAVSLSSSALPLIGIYAAAEMMMIYAETEALAKWIS